MGKIAFVFSGQGAQHTGMAKDFFASVPAVADLFERAEAVRPGTLAQMFEGDGTELKQTQNTQPCLYLADMAAALALKHNGIEPEGLAGFSLGEIPALAVGGAYSDADGFRIAMHRGAAMAKAGEGQDVSMMACVKLPTEQVEQLCEPYDKVFPVNYNSPVQLVVSGDKAQLEALAKDIKAAKGRGVMLNVSGAFHSPYMTPAVEPFGRELSAFDVKLPEIPVYANFTAAPYEGDPKSVMLEQINHPVQWVKLIRRMAEDGFDTFIECGVGNTLQKLISQILPEAKVFRVEDTATLGETLDALKA
ncbi:MAG: ACP S-malonyltransferase [Oscillospiraceae bacterium]|nr:ACP S-malonyltransferase [Oscillospiraceae bacterium]